MYISSQTYCCIGLLCVYTHSRTMSIVEFGVFKESKIGKGGTQ